ncbi:unnamed protein product, partial [Phaeothamnion confervicola]
GDKGGGAADGSEEEEEAPEPEVLPDGTVRRGRGFRKEQAPPSRRRELVDVDGPRGREDSDRWGHDLFNDLDGDGDSDRPHAPLAHHWDHSNN